MKKFCNIFLIVILLSCSSINDVKIGTYSSHLPNKISRAINRRAGITGYIGKSEIILKKDSTYIYYTCGNINTGNWYCKGDSLFLIVKTNRFRNDSLHEFGYEGAWPEVPDTNTWYYRYKIKKKYLVSAYLFISAGDTIITAKGDTIVRTKGDTIISAEILKYKVP